MGWLQLKIYRENYKNLPHLRWVDYIWESIVKAIKIHLASDGMTIIENVRCMLSKSTLPQAGWLYLKIYYESHKNLPHLKWVDYCSEFMINAIKIDHTSDMLTKFQNL